MRACLLLAVLLSTVPAAAGEAAWPAHCRPEAAGVRDMALLYCDAPWPPETLRPYVAYLDRQGHARDQLFDGFLFLRFGGAPSGQRYVDGPTTRADWEFFLDELLAPGGRLATLDAVLAEAGRELKRLSMAASVAVMVPYPARAQRAFGDRDGDGASEDLSTDAAQCRATGWFVAAFAERFARAQYRHLRLWGYYWMSEGVRPDDEAVVRGTADAIHALGCRFLWIPWFAAPGVERWRALGFDLVTLQPNYAFLPPAGGCVPDESRLAAAASRCRRSGMGIEMEMHDQLLTVPQFAANARLYLDHGDAALGGYGGNVSRTWYPGGDAIARLCRSDRPEMRRLYDDIYRFQRGRYRRRGITHPLRSPRIDGAALGSPGCLVDGYWQAHARLRPPTIEVSGRASFTFALPADGLVGDVRVHFAGGREDDLARMAVSVSDRSSGSVFTVVGSAASVPPDADAGGGWALIQLDARPARRLRVAVRARPGRRLRISEVALMAAPHRAWGLPCRVEGRVRGDVSSLTDGIAGGRAPVVWAGRHARGSVDLQETASVHSVLVHLRRVKGHAFSPRVFVETTAPGEAPRRCAATLRLTSVGAWAVAAVDRPVQRVAVELSDAAAGTVAVDEVAVLAPANLARDCAYALDPAPAAAYPDSPTGKLTNGVLTVKGFPDGRMVGWYGAPSDPPVTCMVDLGAARAVDAVAVHAQGGGLADVYHPDSMEVSLSVDGERWTDLPASTGGAHGSRPVGARRWELGWLQVRAGRARARLVRIRLRARQWLLLSEVRVLAGGRNLALRRSYTLHPQPTLPGQTLELGTRLTDGFACRSPVWWDMGTGYVRLESPRPTVTVALGRVRRVSGASLHLAAGPGGAAFPRGLRGFLSFDGRAWTPVAESRTPPAGIGHRTDWMRVRFAPRSARFVRIHVDTGGQLTAADEVEVVGR